MTVHIRRNPEARPQVAGALAAGMHEWGAAVAAEAERNAPRLTGFHSRSFFVLVLQEGRRVLGRGIDANGRVVPDQPTHGAELELVVGTNSGYGGLLETGTSDTAAQPSLGPAAMNLRRAAQRLVAAGASKFLGSQG